MVVRLELGQLEKDGQIMEMLRKEVLNQETSIIGYDQAGKRW
jgi:hypothetical protein